MTERENLIGRSRSIWYDFSMSITAVIEQGLIKLPKDIPWASGTVVRIEPVEDQIPTLFEIFERFEGMADDLPPDLASNLNH